MVGSRNARLGGGESSPTLLKKGAMEMWLTRISRRVFPNPFAEDWHGGLARRTGTEDRHGGQARRTGTEDWHGGLARKTRVLLGLGKTLLHTHPFTPPWYPHRVAALPKRLDALQYPLSNLFGQFTCGLENPEILRWVTCPQDSSRYQLQAEIQRELRQLS
jgi:hypothetical protein